jgi:hypothetical protein
MLIAALFLLPVKKRNQAAFDFSFYGVLDSLT